MNIYDKLYELTNAIKTSAEYQRYKYAAEKVEQNPTHSQMLKDYLKVQMQIQMAKMMGTEPTQEMIDQFNMLYTAVSPIESIGEFMQAQAYFSSIVDDIMKAITDATKIDASFLDIYPNGLFGEEE